MSSRAPNPPDSLTHTEAPRRAVRRRTLAVEVADVLREMILVGELAPGQRTTQDELAQRLDVSTMPVREALLRLASEGFVEAAPNRSFAVARTSRRDIQDVYWMHAIVAGELTRRACERMDDELLGRVRRRAEAFSAALHAADDQALEQANWRFHQEINRAADAPKLLLVLRTTLRFIPRGFYALLPAWGHVSEQGHARIVEALGRRDPDAARAAAEEHVREAGDLVIELFSAKGYWTRPGSAA